MARVAWWHAGIAVVAFAWAGTAVADQETRFQDWKMLCEDGGPAAERDCIITQKVVNDKTGSNVLAVAIGFAKGAKVPSMAVKVAKQVAPSAPVLDPKKGLGLVIDRKAPHTTGFVKCDETICLANAPLNDAYLLKDGKAVPLNGKDGAAKDGAKDGAKEGGKDAGKDAGKAPANDLLGELKSGKEMIFTFQLEGQPKRTGVALSLKGFGAAYKALVDKHNKKS